MPCADAIAIVIHIIRAGKLMRHDMHACERLLEPARAHPRVLTWILVRKCTVGLYITDR